MKKIMFGLSVLLLSTVYTTSFALDFALDAHGGTMGVGIGGTVKVNNFLNVRGGINTFEVGADFDESDLSYKADLELDNQYVFLDIHPFGNTLGVGKFRVSVGVISNGNGFSGSAVSDAGAQLGDAAAIISLPTNSTVDLDISYKDSVASYVGIGFGNAVSNDGGFGFAIDLGIVATGNLDIDIDLDQATRDAITAAPSAVTNADIDDAIAAEVAKIEDNDDFKDIDVWPLLQIGLSYGF